MCGIIGGIGQFSNLNKNIVNIISHRGPDGNGFYENKKLFLGHTRLSIQDLSENGQQPMFSEDGNYVIIFNGEIYNHWEIRKELEKEFNFRSTSDTETVLNSYIKYGNKFVEKLNGIFALAIFNISENTLFIARDQFGVKPLYVYSDDEKYLFSSEIKSFLQFDINKELNPVAFQQYLSLLWASNSLTPMKNVKKVSPGSYIEINLNNEKTNPLETKYYTIPFNGKYIKNSLNEVINTLDDKLTKAVERQLLSDVPVGFFLSGGLDSSLILAIAKKLRPNERFECFTVDVGQNKIDEMGADLHYAQLVAKQLDVNLNIIKIDDNVFDEFDKIIWHLDEPQADAAPLNVLKICEAARKKGIKVMLGGTGGDDVFSGYRRHQALNYEKYFKIIPFPVKRFIKTITKNLPVSNPTVRRIKKVSENLNKTSIDRMIGYFNWMEDDTVIQLFKPEIRKTLKQTNSKEFFKEYLKEIPKEKNILNQNLYLELKTFLMDHNLNYTDKVSMSTGVEVRVPFLDLELVNFSTQISPKLKMKGNEAKYILKKVAERYISNDIIYRKKTGFGAPVREWVTSKFEDRISKALSKENIEKIGLFEFEKVEKLIKDNKLGTIDASYTILSLLAIQSWYNQFIEK